MHTSVYVPSGGWVIAVVSSTDLNSTPALLSVSHLTMGESLILSEPQFPLENGDTNSTYSIELLQLNETNVY